jgi:RNA polymerase sigma factor (sigma-70 family)
LTQFLDEPRICSFSACLENALPDGGDSPESAAQAAQRRQVVAAALATLTSNQRAVVLMRYRDGQSWREIGIALHVTGPAACRTGTRAIAALRRWLAAYDIHSADSL